MGASAVSLASGVLKTAVQLGVNQNGQYDIWTSVAQSNPNLGNRNLRLIVEYNNVLPVFGADPITFELGLVVEALNGVWFPIAYQFEPFRTADQGTKRIIVLGPDINTFDSGVDDVMYVGGILARISRQQGVLAEQWRAKVILTESGAGQPGSFQQVLLNVYGEVWP